MSADRIRGAPARTSSRRLRHGKSMGTHANETLDELARVALWTALGLAVVVPICAPLVAAWLWWS